MTTKLNWEGIERKAVAGLMDPELQNHLRDRLRVLEQQGIESADSLREVLTEEKSSDLLAECCWLAGFVDDDLLARKLVTVLQHSSDAVVVWEAAKALSVKRLHETEISRVIETLMRTHGDTLNRIASAYVLGAVGGDDAAQVLSDVLRDVETEATLRGQAAEALGNTGSVLAVTPLIESASDLSPEVRYWSVFSLGKIGDSSAREVLRRAVNDEAVLPDGSSVADEARIALAHLDTI